MSSSTKKMLSEWRLLRSLLKFCESEILFLKNSWETRGRVVKAAEIVVCMNSLRGIGSGQSEGEIGREREGERETIVKTKFRKKSKTIGLLMYSGNLGSCRIFYRAHWC